MAAGDKAFWSDLANAVNPPIVQLVAQSGGQSLTAAAALSFGAGSEVIDTHNFHDTTINPTRITPTIAGTYRLTASVLCAANTFTKILMVFRKNAANVPPLIPYHPDAAASQDTGFQLTTLVQANGTTDYFEIVCQLFPSGTTTSASGGVEASVFECEYRRP